MILHEKKGGSINRCNPKQCLPTSILTLPAASSEVYIGQKLSSVTLTGGEGSVEGTFSWTEPDEVITGSKEYSVTFIPASAEYAPSTSETLDTNGVFWAE